MLVCIYCHNVFCESHGRQHQMTKSGKKFHGMAAVTKNDIDFTKPCMVCGITEYVKQ